MDDFNKGMLFLGIMVIFFTAAFFIFMVPAMRQKDLKEYQAYIKETGNTQNLTQDEYIALYIIGHYRR